MALSKKINKLDNMKERTKANEIRGNEIAVIAYLPTCKKIIKIYM